jgi:hypothetical protein
VSGSRQTVVAAPTLARRRARQPPLRRGLAVKSASAGCAGVVRRRVGAAEARDPVLARSFGAKAFGVIGGRAIVKTNKHVTN